MPTTQTLPFLSARRIRKGFTFSSSSLAHLDQQGKRTLDVLSDAYTPSIRWYKRSGFEIVNRYLRGQGIEERNERFYTVDEWNDRAMRGISSLDTSLAKVEADTKHGYEVLYRLVTLTKRSGDEEDPRMHSADESALNEYLAKFKVGSIIEEPAYISTTVDSDFIVKIERERKFPGTNVVWEITTERGAVIHEHVSGGYSIQDEEREVLLPRGMKFRVHAIHRDVTFQSNEVNRHGSRLYAIPLTAAEKRTKMTVIQMVAVED